MPKLSNALGGLRPHEVTIFCAPTGAGKTEWLASLSAQLVAQKVSVFAAPVETGDIDFGIRVLSMASGSDLNSGEKFSDTDLNKIVTKYATSVGRSPLYIAHYDNRVSIEELKTVLEYANQNHGVQVAVLDNLNFFLDVRASRDQLIEMDRAIHELVLFAKKFPMHTILVCHPRKTDNGQVTSEYDIKGSSTAVQECANVLLMNRLDKEAAEQFGPESHGVREFVFKKIRKRGRFVNKKIYMTMRNGFYEEIV